MTPANEVATWTIRTDEQFRIQSRLMRLGVAIETGKTVGGFDGDNVRLECLYTASDVAVAAGTLMLVTARQSSHTLWNSLSDRRGVTRIGDCIAPGTIATAVYAGHRFAANSRATPRWCSSASIRRWGAPADSWRSPSRAGQLSFRMPRRS